MPPPPSQGRARAAEPQQQHRPGGRLRRAAGPARNPGASKLMVTPSGRAPIDRLEVWPKSQISPSDVAHFSRRFKAAYGLSPRVFRATR
jgi:hypothetical protein